MTKKLEDVFSQAADEAVDQARDDAERRRRKEDERQTRQSAALGESTQAAAALVTKTGGHVVHNARFGIQTIASIFIPAGLGLSAGVMLAALLDHIQKNRTG